MGENLIPKLAEWLGLVEGDEFEIEGYTYNPYKYIDGRFVDREGDRMYGGLFINILYGEAEVKKLPWRPKRRDLCYRVGIDGDVLAFHYGNDSISIAMLAFGNCFRTREEATNHVSEILAKMAEWQ